MYLVWVGVRGLAVGGMSARGQLYDLHNLNSEFPKIGVPSLGVLQNNKDPTS